MCAAVEPSEDGGAALADAVSCGPGASKGHKNEGRSFPQPRLRL